MSEIETLKKRLEDAEAALRFYGDRYNWQSADTPFTNDTLVPKDDFTLFSFDGLPHFKPEPYAGRRAREYFEKWKDKDE